MKDEEVVGGWVGGGGGGRVGRPFTTDEDGSGMVVSGISAWRCSEDSAEEGLERGAWLAEGHLGHVGWSGRGECVAPHSGGGGRRWEGTLAPHGARACEEERGSACVRGSIALVLAG